MLQLNIKGCKDADSDSLLHDTFFTLVYLHGAALSLSCQLVRSKENVNGLWH